MKLIHGKQYKIKWLDAFGDANWTDAEQLEKLIKTFETPSEQTLYFIKQTKDFYIFTSGKLKPDSPYIDIHGVPKGWAIKITLVR